MNGSGGGLQQAGRNQQPHATLFFAAVGLRNSLWLRQCLGHRFRLGVAACRLETGA